MRLYNSENKIGFRTSFVPYIADDNRISRKLFYFMFSLLLLTNILTFIALFFSADISRFLDSKNAEIIAAYEDRIAQLRIEVDRLYSRQYAQNGNLNLQLVELAQKQAALLEIQPIVKSLAESANNLGLLTGKNEVNLETIPSFPVKNEFDNISTGSIEEQNNTKQQQINSLRSSIYQLSNDMFDALNSLSLAAEKSTNEIVSYLEPIGFAPKFGVNSTHYDKSAMGGPMIEDNIKTSELNFIDDANKLLESLERLKEAKRAIDLAPIFMPLSGSYRLSSRYGKRSDPINGRRAFHSGNDYAAPYGSDVRSAGDGVVIFAGLKGGYGKAVEIKHKNGIITRYAHMSAYLVRKGQNVRAGDLIGKVGSSGRSTGAHLHFEVRSTDKALDPNKFLQAGKYLAQYRN